MKKIIIAVLVCCTFGCGAQAKAIEHAELACLEADLQTLTTKVATLLADPTAEVESVTDGELLCAGKALGVSPTVLAPKDAGTD